ncbi:MAG: hypothetical protein NZ828_03740 [Alphaproteobacteria bacterium]|nr:hypothetical protein [Alphaproteobacteria bacterium]
MTQPLSTSATGKLLVSIFSAMNPVVQKADINDKTADIVHTHMKDIGFDIKLPLKIRLADDYAEIFAHIFDQVNDDDLRAYASEKAMHAANFGLNGATKYREKFQNVVRHNTSDRITLAKSVIDDMQRANIIDVAQNFSPIIR